MEKILALVGMYPTLNLFFHCHEQEHFHNKENFTTTEYGVIYGDPEYAIFLDLLSDKEPEIYLRINKTGGLFAFDNFSLPEEYNNDDMQCLLAGLIPEKVNVFLTILYGPNWEKDHSITLRIEQILPLSGKKKL